MKKIWNRMVCVMMLCILVTAATISANAAGTIDTNRDVALTISYQYNGTAISGAKFDAYKVADVDAYAQMKVTDRFAEYPIPSDHMSQDDWNDFATTLKSYVWKDSLKPDFSGQTDGTGNWQTTVKPGLYLVVGSRCDVNDMTYTASPFVVFLPGSNEEQNTWEYAVTASPKADGEKKPSTDTRISRKVLKIWEDGDKKTSRPKDITIHLMCDGKVYDTVKLNAEDDWRHTWDNLEQNHEWLVSEDTVSGYTQNIAQEGTTFTVKNTSTTKATNTSSKPKDSSLPRTGLLWWPALALMAGGLLCVVIGLVRRRGADGE